MGFQIESVGQCCVVEVDVYVLVYVPVPLVYVVV
jgi:hypothetical protein